MQYGFTLPGRGPFATADHLATLAKHGEALGYHTLHTGDHIVVPKRMTRGILTVTPVLSPVPLPGNIWNNSRS